MRFLGRALLVVVAMLLATNVWAAQYAEVNVEVPIDASAVSNLVAVPDSARGINTCPDGRMGDVCITTDAARPEDQLGFDVLIENRGTSTCTDIFANRRSGSVGLTMQNWPTGPVPPTGSAVLRVILTVADNAPDLETLAMRLGLVCVR